MIFSVFEPDFMRLALVASIATGAALGTMSVYLAMRRVVFFGLVIANAATAGAAVAEAVGWQPVTASLLAAIGAATALGRLHTSRTMPTEALMGWAYAAAASVTVLVLSQAAAGSSDTLLLLFGNVLAVQVSDAIVLTCIAVAIGVLHLLFSRRFLLVTFDREAAAIAGVRTRLWSLALNLTIGVAASAAVHSIGALSTFALLALPSMTALAVTTSIRAAFLTAAGLGAALPSLALVLAFHFDLPPGPTAVALLALGVPVAVAGRNLSAAAARIAHGRRRPNGRMSRIRASLRSRVFLIALVCGGFVSAAEARQQAPDAQAIRGELERLRLEFDAMQRQYTDQLRALEARLAVLEAGRPSVDTSPEQKAAPPTTAVPPGVAADGQSGPLPIYGNASAQSKIFNPDIAAMGNFLSTAGSNPVQSSPAFALDEIETSLQAIVDPYARADFFLAFSPAGVDVEEAYATFPTLPGGLLLKAGKLRGAFGKVNTMHTHVLPWSDRPLVTENLLGGNEGIADAGVSVARLLPNPWIFLEATGEVYRGDSAVFHSYEPGDLAYFGRVRGYQDISESSNVDVGASIAWGHSDTGPSETTRVIGIDGTFRYRPLQRAIYRRLLARTELVWSRRSEADGSAFGGYVSGDYQFARRWFGGVRLDYSERALNREAADRGASGLLTFWPSEFSQVRGQYRRTLYAEGQAAHEVLIQLLFSIGAHGAHAF